MPRATSGCDSRRSRRPAARALREILTDKVHVANPFDFHTHTWFDLPEHRAMFDVVLRSGYDAVGFMLDCPPPPGDATAYVNVVEEFAAALPGRAQPRGADLLAAGVHGRRHAGAVPGRRHRPTAGAARSPGGARPRRRGRRELGGRLAGAAAHSAPAGRGASRR